MDVLKWFNDEWQFHISHPVQVILEVAYIF